MNAGFANLSTLKRHLLPETWETETTLDALLLDLGNGVAAALENWCGRRFVRLVDFAETFTAETQVLQLALAPVEGDPVLALRSSGSATWETQTDVIDNMAASAGLVYLTAALGTRRDRVRVTYTGGFWFSTAEDSDSPQTLPVGATELPAGLRLAWLLQCQHIFTARELMGTKALPSGKAGGAAAGPIDLLPAVKDALQPFRLLAL